MYLLRNVDLLKRKLNETTEEIGRHWINLGILPSKEQKPSTLNGTSIEEDDEPMTDQENRRTHNRGGSSLSKKR